MADKKYYWLKLKRDFFKRHDIRIIEAMPNGKDYILFYLKLLLESIDHNGELRFSETIPYNEQMLSVITNTNIDIVKAAMDIFIELKMIEIFDDSTIFMNEVNRLIGSETAGAERVRKYREKTKVLPTIAKTNAERQKAHRAKQACEGKQHIPYIEDNQNKKRYGGNYYIVMKRDCFKCKICGSIENLCVHHIEGFDEQNPQNSAENKMLVTCRACHSQIHAGTPIPNDILESIDYFMSNESNENCNSVVTKSNTEKEKEKEKEIDLEKEAEAVKADDGDADNELKNFDGVFLTENQTAHLLSIMPIELFDRYIAKVKAYPDIINPYKTILKWHSEDCAVNM